MQIDRESHPSAADLAALAENLPELAWMARPDGWIFWFNRRWYDYTGTTPEAMQGWGWQSVHDPAALASILRLWTEAIEKGAPMEAVFPLKGADGTFRDFLTRVRPIHDETGRVLRWIGTNTEISSQSKIARDLAEEMRHLKTLNETSAQVSAELDLERLVQTVTDAGVSLTGAEFGAFFYNTVDQSGESLTLYTISGVPREKFSQFPNPRATHVFSPTFRGDGPVRSDDILADPRYGLNPPYKGMPKGHLPVRSYLAVSVKSRSGEVMGGLFFGHPEPGRFTARHEELLVGIAGQAAIGIDNARLYEAAQKEIKERREAEKHREMLINELNHRVKNTLATVQSVASQTLRNAGVDTAVRQTLEARLMALSHAQDLLTGRNWEGASLSQVVEMALEPHRLEGEKRFEIEGPEVPLGPKTALAMAMALHELVTNAIRHGALSGAGGRVRIAWAIAAQAEGERLCFTWAESGGPTVRPNSARSGFGTRLITRGLTSELGGEVRLDYAATGLVCSIDAPLPRPQILWALPKLSAEQRAAH